MIRVTVWNENVDDAMPAVAAVHPGGIHQTLADFLAAEQDFYVRVATLDMPDYGLPDGLLDTTDVLIWWGHKAHERLPDELAKKIADRVLLGMGFIPLHSSHACKAFRMLMGTSCSLRWREGDYARLWCMMPGHPIADGVPAFIDLPQEEMYGEHFDIPQPDALVYGSWFSGGEIFRSGCCFIRGAGKIFYFQPGHETDPSYHNPDIQRIIINAVRWAAPHRRRTTLDCFHNEKTTNRLMMDGLGDEVVQY